MIMSPKTVLGTVLLISFISCAYGKSDFLLTVPSVLHRDTVEKACVTLQYLSDVRLVLEIKNSSDYVFLAQSLSLPNKLSDCFDLDITSALFGSGIYNLTVTEYDENDVNTFTDSAEVRVEGSENLIFIQPDKAIYKPGQTVGVRVLVVGANLKPRLEPLSEVVIEDPNGVRIMQWLDQDVMQYQGIADLEMPLSTEPILGEWKVSVRPGPNDEHTAATFKVEEYVLPKYDIKITPPGYMTVNVKQAKGQVCAMYTYGEPVRGTLTLNVCYDRFFYPWQKTEGSEYKCVHSQVKITGCHDFDLSVDDLEIDRNLWGHSTGDIVFTATVVEDATDVSLNAKAKVEVTRDEFKLDFKLHSPDTFRPGLPYNGKLMVTRPDGTPAPNEQVEIHIDSNPWITWMSNNKSEVTFTLPPEKMKNQSSISLRATMPDHVYNYDERRLYPYTPNGYFTVRQWYSPTGSYLQIEPITEVPACDSQFTFNVTHITEPVTYVHLFYQLMSRGNLLKSGTLVKQYSEATRRIYDEQGMFEESSLYDCPEGMEWHSCGSACVETCSPPPIPCTLQCVPRCECPFGQVFHDGRCVERDDCPDADADPDQEQACSGGRVFSTCASSCTPTCDDPTPLCTMQCTERCACPDSMPLLDTSTSSCVTKHSCTNYDPSTDPDFKRVVVALPVTVHITPDMSPDLQIIVYYVRQDGETVADSTSVKVTECTNNKVELSFNAETLYPGEETELTVKAEPGSACSVGALDKSVSLLAGDNAMTLSEVFNRLAPLKLTERSFAGKDTYCEEQIKARAGEGDTEPGPPGSPSMGPKGVRNKRDIIWPQRYYSNYYDSMRAFRTTGSIVLGSLVVETRPCRMMSGRFAYSALPLPVEERLAWAPGADVELDSDLLETEDVAKSYQPEKKKKKGVDVRSYFPETWLWDLHFVDNSGQVTVKTKLPHTITEWVASSFCSHTSQGLGVAQNAAIKGFQPFFLSLTLPVSVVRLETLKLPVTVFNYLSECLVVSITLEQTAQYTVVGDHQSEHCVCGQESATAYFNLRFVEIGDIPIKVAAESVDNNGVCGNSLFMSDQIGVKDAVERLLLVEAEGREVEQTDSRYVCPEEEETIKWEKSLELPEDYVEGTGRASVSVIGDIMGPTLSGLDRLVNLPMGCGEQNMILFAPNIYVMQYLTGINKVSEDISRNALKFMRTGYQRELTYRHNDGSYSAFGKNDASGSTWLTAYVLKAFAQAKQFISIDPEHLRVSAEWLLSKQMPNGAFRKVGTVHHKDMKGGVNGGASLTTFVLVALLESKNHIDIDLDTAINEGFRYVEFQSVTDTYTLTMLAYAYALRGINNQHRAQVLSTLEDRAITEEGLTHWARSDPPQPPEPVDGMAVDLPRPQVPMDVEMTAYKLLSLVNSTDDDSAVHGVPLVKWLNKQRNSRGGFSSTQNTVVALQALAHFAALVQQDDLDISVSVTPTVGDGKTFPVSPQNSLLLQRMELADVPTNISFDIRGTGCALVQTSLKYNVQNVSRSQPAFSLRVEAARHDKCKVRNIHVCAAYEATDGASNMAVIEVKMVSGWIPVKSSIKELMTDFGLGLKKYELDMNKVNFYFDELTSSSTCFRFLVEQLVEVEGVKPGSAEVYDYYDDTEELRVTETYEISPICGTKEELPDIDEDEYEEMHRRDPWDIEQVRMPSRERSRWRGSRFGGFARKFRDDFERERLSNREPEPEPEVDEPLIVPVTVNPLGNGEQPPVPGSNPGQTGTKEDLPPISQEEFEEMNNGDPANIEQVRVPNREPELREEVVEPVIVPEEAFVLGNEEEPPVQGSNPGQTGTKEDLPDITRDQYEAMNNRDPANIEQVRQPPAEYNPGQTGTKEDLEHLTEEEYEERNNRDPADMEQVRVPDRQPELSEEDLCPQCFDSVPDNIAEEVCQFAHAYKTVLRPPAESKILKLKEDYLVSGSRFNENFQLQMLDVCDCIALTYVRNGKVLILTPTAVDTASNPGQLSITNQSRLYAMPKPKRQLQEIQRKIEEANCP